MEYTYKIHQDTPDHQNKELERYEREVFGTTEYSEQYADTLPKVIARYMEEAKIGTNKLSRLTGIPKLQLPVTAMELHDIRRIIFVRSVLLLGSNL